MLELLYDADFDGMDHYDQDEESVIINTYLAEGQELPSVANIRVYDHKKRRTELFNGTVNIGDSFEVTGEKIRKKWIPPKLIIEIRDGLNGGGVLQEIEFHTSCSQPLFVGDQFGGVAVYDFSR